MTYLPRADFAPGQSLRSTNISATVDTCSGSHWSGLCWDSLTLFDFGRGCVSYIAAAADAGGVTRGSLHPYQREGI
jgi:hypothetical protein